MQVLSAIAQPLKMVNIEPMDVSPKFIATATSVD
jgi:hypothetical protein